MSSLHLLSVFYSQILAINTATALSPIISCSQTRSSKQNLKALVSSGDYTIAMAISKLLIASLIVSLLVLQKVNASQAASSIPGKNMGASHIVAALPGHAAKDANVTHKGTSGNLKDANVTMKDSTCPCCGATMTAPGGRRMLP
ncbi:hypothetical protein POTOM_009358 [Populus tomentosa]|uniref:Uncharacterized protein n=1 Tax=Populus tomentosa TaxID=118781 RepID=A0A8X8ABV5_POPTO|nr:hypothetical protein POTOM_009358 [Populus tomentosa]